MTSNDKAWEKDQLGPSLFVVSPAVDLNWTSH